MKRPCLTDGCWQLTTRSYCAQHQPKQTRPYRYRPQYDGAWQRTSRAARQAQPWCSRCGSTSDLTVDHVSPRSLEAGIQVLCRSCNSRKGGHRG